ncbi:serpin-like protein HMSD, partial [Plectropomus leopardus]|uniref:serpin-like protein HMSD n=1 Tax=Plectropomus leopardus TaxID=160734 RepID=UPI001C4C718F
MVMLGTAGNTAKQISEVLCFTDAEQPKLEEAQLSQMQTQMQTCQQMTVQQQIPKDGEDDVNSGYKKLLTAINKENKSYDLSTANRLYGEQTFEFKE